jgi:hypothetical protein
MAPVFVTVGGEMSGDSVRKFVWLSIAVGLHPWMQLMAD